MILYHSEFLVEDSFLHVQVDLIRTVSFLVYKFISCLIYLKQYCLPCIALRARRTMLFLSIAPKTEICQREDSLYSWALFQVSSITAVRVASRVSSTNLRMSSINSMFSFQSYFLMNQQLPQLQLRFWIAFLDR